MPDLAAYRTHVLRTLQLAHVIKASDEDLEHLELPGVNAVAQASPLLQKTGASFIALTRGPHGASLLTRGGQVFHAAEAAKLDVVDTVGAGDCFLAGLVTTMLDLQLTADWGKGQVDPAQARQLLANAIASASICVQRRGCNPPVRAEVRPAWRL